MLFSKNDFNKIKRPGFHKKKFIYTKRTYSNPFFRHKGTAISGTGGFLSNKIKLTVFALAVAIIIFVWLIFFSSLFKITKIEVSGVGDNTAQKVESLAKGVAENKLLGKNNLLLYNKSELNRILNDTYFLQNLSIKKKWFHTLKIIFEERRPVAVWHEDDKYFYLDGEGNVINRADSLSINRLSYPIIENLTNIKIEGRKANVNWQTIDYILSLFSEFKDKKHGFEIEKFILDKDVNTVKMAILAGPKIYFNTEEAVEPQASRLDLIIKEKLKDSFKSKEYINLRYGNNIYIK